MRRINGGGLCQFHFWRVIFHRQADRKNKYAPVKTKVEFWETHVVWEWRWAPIMSIIYEICKIGLGNCLFYIFINGQVSLRHWPLVTLFDIHATIALMLAYLLLVLLDWLAYFSHKDIRKTHFGLYFWLKSQLFVNKTISKAILGHIFLAP